MLPEEEEEEKKKIEMAVFKLHSMFFFAGMKVQLNKGGQKTYG